MVLLDKKSADKALDEVFAQKGERKFVQSVDLALNFQDVDFTRAEGRINVEVVLPYAANSAGVCVFADGQVATEAQKAGAKLVVASTEIDAYAKDKKKQKELLKYSLLATPQLMVPIGKALGKVLGARGKTPRPIPPNAHLSSLISNASRTLVLRAKGKFLPSVHCQIGKENMPREQLIENVLAVFAAIEKAGFDIRVKSAYLKTTMGKPVKVGAQVARDKTIAAKA